MIYITGDTHGEPERFEDLAAKGEQCWNSDDVLIVCGDFGYIFANDDKERRFLDVLAEKPYTICFCDGNHENFPAIFIYPRENWNGGQIHRIRRNIIHLMRGQVYTIQNKTFFTMGGAYSRDRFMRIKQSSYWEEELPSNEEYREANADLRECGYAVDYVITHTAPREIIRAAGKHPDIHDAELTGYLDWVMHELTFKQWFFGHWHLDRQINKQFRALWWDVVCLE